MENEAPLHHARGGWITFPFILATMAGLSLSSGWTMNLITFLKDEFHIHDTDAAKIGNNVSGSITFMPIIGAVLADSFVGSFSVVSFSSLASLSGLVVLLLTTSVNHLRPPSCEKGSISCKDPSSLQSTVLYLGLILSSVGAGGSRFTLASMGADQFDSTKHQGTFFNWFIFTMYVTYFVSATVLVYVEEKVSWTWGFAVLAMANVASLVIFLSGRKFYRLVAPKSSPFKGLACVVVAAIKKQKMELSEKVEDYHHSFEDGSRTLPKMAPTPFLRFLNRAALKSLEDSRSTEESSSSSNPWRLCTVQQVEDLKRLIKLIPIWLSGLILSVPIAIQMSFTVIQGKTMNNHITSHFKIPAASIQICGMISTCLTISLLDRLVFPLWTKLSRAPPTPLQRVGIGHVLTLLSMIISALVESERLKEARSPDLREKVDAVVPFSLLWLAPQLVVVGASEGFHFAGQIAFYYEEFPESFKSTATAVVSMSIGGAFYSSNVVIELVRKGTGWLPNNINRGRLDNVFWLCSVMGGLNLVFFLVCASLYRCHKSSN